MLLKACELLRGMVEVGLRRSNVREGGGERREKDLRWRLETAPMWVVGRTGTE